ncbi:MAG: hypothetical protein IPG45_08735 [Deltaproteobacteria bacterium]|jgi:hypothetical protein|nr:hypothetical protein [Deltaproteobacteria bacterium]
MVEKTTSQTQQDKANPFQKVAEENYARMEAYFADWQKLQEKQIKEMQAAVDESAKLFKESLTYGAKMAAEWQKISMQTTKQAAQIVTGTWVS